MESCYRGDSDFSRCGTDTVLWFRQDSTKWPQAEWTWSRGGCWEEEKVPEGKGGNKGVEMTKVNIKIALREGGDTKEQL